MCHLSSFFLLLLLLLSLVLFFLLLLLLPLPRPHLFFGEKISEFKISKKPKPKNKAKTECPISVYQVDAIDWVVYACSLLLDEALQGS